MLPIDNQTVRAVERERYAVKEYFDGGLVRATIGLRPTAYYDGSAYREIANEFIDSGISERPHIVTAAPIMLSVGDGGTRRIHPTREMDVYLEIGRPHNVTTRQPYPLNAFSRNGNLLTSVNSTANLYVWMAGHYSKLGIELKGAWKTSPPAQVAFPVTLSGLTWDNGVLRKDGAAVMRLAAPIAYDMDNELSNRRAMNWSFTQLAGQWYVILDLPTGAQMSGWNRPLIDPTLTLQPDSSTGQDTLIEKESPAFNYGTLGVMVVGTNAAASSFIRGLLQPDISAIPIGALIITANLRLYCPSEANTTDRTVGAHRGLTQWFEGNQAGATLGAGVNGSTWNLRNNNGAVAWAGGVGGGSGSDYAAVATASTSITAPLAYYDWNVLADVQAWYTGTSNFGWWLINASEATTSSFKRFVTSDGTTAAERPELTIVYSIGGGTVFNAAFSSSFRGAFG